MNNKIFLAGCFRAVEAPAAATIFPGTLLQQNASGFIPHGTAGGWAEKLVAFEDALQGGTILGYYGLYQLGNSAPVGYTVAGVNGQGPDLVQAGIMQSGALCLMLLLAGYNYTVGTQLISDGAGHLKPTTGTPAQIIAVIPGVSAGLPALNLSASGAVNTLGAVRFL
jgi:hypothetical protein